MSPTPRCGAGGSTTTTTAAISLPLEKYGLVIPHDLIEEAWNQIWNKGYVHEVAQFFATGWLANYWRIDPMTDEDFEWFEYKYPGWYDKYGKWWENYNRLSMPNGHHPIVAEDVDYVYPHRCWTCMVPCLVREDMTMAEVDGQMAHVLPRGMPVDRRRRPSGRPTRAARRRTWASSSASANGRPSTTAGTGPTSSATWASSATTARRMVAQPHLNLDPKKMWTLDHLRRMPAGARARTCCSTR